MKSTRSSAVAALFVLGISGLAWCQPSGWSELWQNHTAQARSRFQQSLQANPDDSSALRGLGWLSRLDGDSQGVLQYWGQLVSKHPDEATSLGVWPVVQETATDLGRHQWLSQLDLAVLAHPQALAPLKDCAQMSLEEMGLLPAGNPGAPGMVTHWKAIGPFDNVSGSGLEKAFIIERGKTDGPVVGKSGISLRWRDLVAGGRPPLVDFGHLSHADDSVFYATTTVTPTRPGPAELLLDPLGACKVWLNGQLVAQHSSYGDNVGLALPIRLSVTLREGPNTLVVKMACREEHAPAFSLALRDSQGGTAVGQELPDPSTLSDPLVGEINEAVPAGVALLRGLASAQAEEGDVALLLAEHLAVNGQYQQAIEVDRQRLKQVPQSGLALWQLSQRLHEDGLEDEARQLRSRALEVLPQLFQARLDSLEDEADSPEKLGQLRQLTAAQPHDFSAQCQLYSTYCHLENRDEARKTLMSLAAQELGSSQIQSLFALLSDEGLHSDAQKLLAEGVKRFPDDYDMAGLQLGEFVKQGRTVDAIAAAEQLAKVDERVATLFVLYDLYHQQHKLDQALNWLTRARQLAPQSAALITKRGDLLQEMGNSSEAMAAYQEALGIDPARVSVREKLRVAAGEKPVLDWLTPAMPVDPAKVKTDLKDSVVYLLDEERTVVYPDTASISVYRAVAKVNDEAGVSALSKLRAPRAGLNNQPTLEIARIYKPDGRVQDMRERSSATTAVFPSLQPGDVVDVQWRIESAPNSNLTHFWTGWKFDIPRSSVVQSHFALASPTKMPLQVQNQGSLAEPGLEQKGEWTIREWRLENIAPLSTFPLASPVSDRARGLYLSTIPDWKTIVDWYVDLSGPLCKPDAIVTEKAREVTSGLTGEEDKIAAIQSYVAQLRYQTTPFRNSAFIPTPGKEVISDGYGDCKDKAALICAMLEAVGIKAQIALVSTRSNGLSIPLPSPWFNHAIVKIDTQRGPLWVDGTVAQADLHSLPQEDQLVPALVIQPATQGLTVTPLANLSSNLTERRNVAKLESNGALTGRFTLHGRGYVSDVLRRVMEKIPENEYDTVGQQVINELTGTQSQIQHTRFSGLKDATKPLDMTIHYRCPHYGTKVDRSWLVPSPFGSAQTLSALRQMLVASRGQSSDLMALRGREKSRCEITLPPHCALSKSRQSQLTNGAGSYTLKLVQQGQTMIATLQVEFNTTRVDKKEAKELSRLISSLEEALTAPILLHF